jgi:hypothetical protein
MKTYRIIQIISLIISAITGIAACFAAVAAFRTVWQMAEQRRASYQPELIVARSSFTSGAEDTIAGLSSFLDWRDRNTQSAALSEYSIRLVNVGLGAAKNVTASWSFPFESFVPKIRKLGMAATPPFLIDYKDGVLSLENPKRTVSFWENQARQTFRLCIALGNRT